jgi:hypothetical protein
MMQMKKHSSYELAPDKPYFKLRGENPKKTGLSPRLISGQSV